MDLNEKFDKWFELNFPSEKFGTLSGAFRLALKTDVAKKAFNFGLSEAFCGYMDTKVAKEVTEYLANGE